MSQYPTEPMRPDGLPPTPVLVQTGVNRRCVRGHTDTRNPTLHPTLALVPALSSAIIGGLLVIAIFALEAWLVPGIMGWTALLLLAGLIVSAIVQVSLGHRGWCFLWRTLRWWLGPLGTLIDPIEMG